MPHFVVTPDISPTTSKGVVEHDNGWLEINVLENRRHVAAVAYVARDHKMMKDQYQWDNQDTRELRRKQESIVLVLNYDGKASRTVTLDSVLPLTPTFRYNTSVVKAHEHSS